MGRERKLRSTMAEKDRKLLHQLQFNFPLHESPFKELGKRVGLSEDKVIARMRYLKKKGLIRYIGAVINSNRVGFESTLLALSVTKKDLPRVVRIINSFENVSHNYLRSDSKFNLWFTLTAPAGELAKEIRKIKRLTGIKRILNLKSEKVYKIDARFKI